VVQQLREARDVLRQQHTRPLLDIIEQQIEAVRGQALPSGLYTPVPPSTLPLPKLGIVLL
jgi:hypothetical protein